MNIAGQLCWMTICYANDSREEILHSCHPSAEQALNC